MLLFEIVPKECEPAPRPNSHRQADPIQAIIRFIFVYGAELSDDRDTRSEPLGIIMNIRPISLTSRPFVERMSSKPSQSDGEAAFRTVLHWIGEDPDRDGLRETPSRVARAFQEYFAGYGQDPEQVLRKTFEEIDGYDEMVVLRGIPFQSHCEHHMAPIVGQAWVAYVPDQRVVGVSKLARVVESYARRLQIQERLTAQIANTIEKVLQPKGVGVVVKAVHHCMSTRGINKQGTDLVTSRMLGCFRQDPMTRQEFLSMVHWPDLCRRLIREVQPHLSRQFGVVELGDKPVMPIRMARDRKARAETDLVPRREPKRPGLANITSDTT